MRIKLPIQQPIPKIEAKVKGRSVTLKVGPKKIKLRLPKKRPGFSLPRQILNAANCDPLEQISIEAIVSRVVALAQVIAEKKFYDYQIDLTQRIVESLLQHDGAAVTGLMARQMGKCLKKGTKVMLASGHLRKVEDIHVGDRLMGDDLSYRTVQSICSGVDTLYTIQPIGKYAEPYTVNSAHILTLLKRGRRGNPDTVVDIPIKEYLALTPSQREIYMGLKAEVDFEEVEPAIDPYWFGLWVGDGRSQDTAVTTGDAEIEAYIRAYARRLGERVSDYEEKGDCTSFAIVGSGALLRLLELHQVLGAKRIPMHYLANSRRVRLQVLAGVVDSDGSLHSPTNYQITQTNKDVALDVQHLARSLGFRASLSLKKTKCQTGAEGVAWKVHIYGKIWEIPVKLARKVAQPTELRENPLTYGFTVKKEKRGEYAGFVIDKNKRFLLGDFTVTHNTEAVSAIVAACVIIFPALAKQFPKSWHLNITDDAGVYRGFRNGLLAGIYAPKMEQSEIMFDRVQKYLSTDTAKKVIKELGLTFEVNNGNKIELSNGSRILCQSASEQSKIEGATHHLLILEEAQDITDRKINKSLRPMVSATMGSILLVGTAAMKKCVFYSLARSNEREEMLTGIRNHFVFPYTVGLRYNSLYGAYVEKERTRMGEDSDEFRTSYLTEWVFERGMFVTAPAFFGSEVAITAGYFSERSVEGIEARLRGYSEVVGIDWGQSHDSTVVCVCAVDWENPIETGSFYDTQGDHQFTLYRKHVVDWFELLGDDYEVQFWKIIEYLEKRKKLAKIVTDSNTCGKPIYDRLVAHFKGTLEVEPFNFQPKIKADGYKLLYADISGHRSTFPAGPIVRKSREYRRFCSQMLDLQKSYKNGLLSVAHPDEKGAHDDFCIPAGASVLTSEGYLPVESITLGMKVWTRDGWQEVIAAGQTGVKEVIRVGNLVATANHPFYCVNKGGFIPLAELSLDDTILSCESYSSNENQEKSKSFEGNATTATPELKKGTPVKNTSIELTARGTLPYPYTALFGSSITGLSRKVMSFITKMKMAAITESPIWNFSPLASTLSATCATQNGWPAASKPLKLQNGRHSPLAIASQNEGDANSVSKPKRRGQIGSIVNWFAKNAEKPSRHEIAPIPKLVPVTVRHAVGDASTLIKFESLMPGEKVPVFNLSVNNCNEYVCQGVLVHNCDAWMMANWGANAPAFGNKLDFAEHNVFYR